MDGPRRCLLLKFGELALKGRNRPLFVAELERNLRRLTADLGTLEIRRRGGVLIVWGERDRDELVSRCLALPGVSVVQPARKEPPMPPGYGADSRRCLTRPHGNNDDHYRRQLSHPAPRPALL